MVHWWQAVTWSGDLVFWFAIPLIVLWKRNPKYSFKLLFGFIANSLLNIFLKYFMLVPRAVGIGPAFPSFHTQTAFFVAVFLYKDHPRASKILFFLAVLVGISRVTLGLHTPLDVIAGAIIGAGFALCFSCLKMRKVNWKEIARQAAHAAGVLAIPAAYYAGTGVAAGALIILAVLAYDAGNRKTVFDFFKRKGEKNLRQGTIFFLSIAGVLLIFPLSIAAPGIIALCIGNSVAPVFGHHFGFTKLSYNKNKTYAGIAVGFAANYIVLYFIVGRELALVLSIVAALVGSIKLNDNVFIPVVVSSILKVIK